MSDTPGSRLPYRNRPAQTASNRSRHPPGTAHSGGESAPNTSNRAPSLTSNMLPHGTSPAVDSTGQRHNSTISAAFLLGDWDHTEDTAVAKDRFAAANRLWALIQLSSVPAELLNLPETKVQIQAVDRTRRSMLELIDVLTCNIHTDTSKSRETEWPGAEAAAHAGVQKDLNMLREENDSTEDPPIERDGADKLTDLITEDDLLDMEPLTTLQHAPHIERAIAAARILLLHLDRHVVAVTQARSAELAAKSATAKASTQISRSRYKGRNKRTASPPKLVDLLAEGSEIASSAPEVLKPGFRDYLAELEECMSASHAFLMGDTSLHPKGTRSVLAGGTGSGMTADTTQHRHRRRRRRASTREHGVDKGKGIGREEARREGRKIGGQIQHSGSI